MKKINWTAVSSVLFSGISSTGLALATASYTTSSSNALCRVAYDKGQIAFDNSQPYNNPYNNMSFIHPGILGACTGLELFLPTLFSLRYIYLFGENNNHYKNLLGTLAGLLLACTTASLTNYYMNKQNTEAAMHECYEMGFKQQSYQDYSTSFALSNPYIALTFFIFTPATLLISFSLAFYAGIQNTNNRGLQQRRATQRSASAYPYSAEQQQIISYQLLLDSTRPPSVPVPIPTTI